MKTNLILTVLTILSLGALALVRAQDDTEKPNEKTPTSPAGATEETVEKPAGIRTDVAVERTLLGGTDTVTVIPVASVFAEGDRYLVLARGSETTTNFREVEVELGRTDGFDVEVTDGLTVGDEVVTISVNQLRFPAFDEGNSEMCGVNGCAPAHGSCDPVTGVCTVKDGDSESSVTCQEGEACTVSCKDCESCQGSVACADCPDCTSKVDLTLMADEFFNGSTEVFCEPASFIGRPPMFPPY